MEVSDKITNDKKQKRQRTQQKETNSVQIGEITLKLDCLKNITSGQEETGSTGHSGEYKLYIDQWKEKTNKGNVYTVPANQVLTLRFSKEDVDSEVRIYVEKKPLKKDEVKDEIPE